ITHTDALGFADAAEALTRLAAVLFLVTGKSDNNAKCQLPLYLRDTVRLTSFPSVQKSKRKQTADVAIKEVGLEHVRVLTSEKFMEVVAALKETSARQKVFLNHFITFLLSDPSYVSQLWALGHSYFHLKAFGKEKDFLSPLVVYKIRGS